MKYCTKCGVDEEDVGIGEITMCNGNFVCSQCRAEEPSCLSNDLMTAREQIAAWQSFAADLLTIIKKCHRGCAHKHICGIEYVTRQLAEVVEGTTAND